MKKFNWRDVVVAFDAKRLEIGNSKFRRVFDLSGGLLRTLSLISDTGEAFAVETEKCCDFECYGSRPEADKLNCRVESVNVCAVEEDAFEAPHALVTVRIFEPYSKTLLCREFYLYPSLAVYSIRNSVETEVLPVFYWMNRDTLRADYGKFLGKQVRWNEPLMDILHPAPGFSPRRTVEFYGHTDVHDHPVVEHDAAGRSEWAGNLLYCENEAGAGVLMLQEAPPSSERRERQDYDFRMGENGDIHSLCWGLLPEELNAGKMLYSCRNAIALYHTAEERERILKDYLRLRFEYSSPCRAIVANAWGCGNFGERLSPQFLKEEIRAAADCGAEFYQIDDQWQTGGNLGMLSIYNQHIPLRDFWAVNPEKVGEGGFDELTKTAEESGIRLALWLAPSSNLCYRDHAEFKRMMLDFHRRYGFSLFKIDHATFPTYEAESNFETMLRETRLESEGKIYFNLDVTAGQRDGYFRLLDYGSLFLENRYACHNWGMGYHPERTLRNFWNLSRYVRAQSLQIEIPYPGDINRSFYAQKGESQPDVYSWRYWAAAAFFANPLLWFAPSSVPRERRGEIREMMNLHRRYRDAIFDGEIFPVGDEPSGASLCGFVSRDAENRNNYAMILREKDAEREELELAGNWECVAGAGEVRGGKLAVTAKAEFALFTKK